MCGKLCFFTTLLFAVPVLAAAASDAVNIAVYWGQISSEGTLRDTCGTGLYAFVNLAFLSTFGAGRDPVLNLAYHCDAPSGNCAFLSADIAACQSAGVKVLLSIGGGALGYNLSSPSDAQDVAAYLWDNFLGGIGTGAFRPLGDAVLDGIDFDIEAPSRYYDDLARNLASLYKGATGGKTYMLTAAPQCPYPDAYLAAALGTGLFDHVWVQFYNNPPCQYAAGDVSTLQSAWQQWTAGMPSATVFLGLPASLDAAGSGFVDADTLVSQVLPVVEGAANYGGIMLWSRSYDKDSGFSVKLQGILQNRNKDTGAGTSSNNKRRIYIIASTSGIVLLCLLFFAFLLGRKKYRSKNRSKETPRIESFLQKNGTLHPKRYTYAQVKRMTKSFAEKLGQGGFGAVYRGDLSDGHQIAVKMLKGSKADGEDFINEVASISKTSHVNVVTLIGFCLQGSKRALIYEYMPNGSLERYAFNENSKGENTLSWEKLFDIAVGIARGLEYLHRGCNTRIVHFDIKPHNILLDQDFCPKISDFGLAKLCLNKESAISIGCARGTIGYIAPEVYSKQFGAVSSKSDVYSYGMMVLEMVGARDKNINANSESSSQYFPQWIYEHLDEYCVSASEINGEITEIIRKMIVVGLWCIQVIPTNRPTITRVVEMLEGSTSGLELPPKVLLTFC